MYPACQSFLVFGLSRSGAAAAEFLLAKKAEVFICDDVRGGAVERTIGELTKKGAKNVKEEDLPSLIDRCDALVLSPGIPVDHRLAVAFKRHKKAVIGETELAARYLKSPIVAVTGTNGKTTTVSMIAEMLTADGKNAKACGNIGTPMLACMNLGGDDVAVAEISSFQLETLSSLRPHVAAVLNIAEDHLNRHYNMENYVFLKSRILKNSAETECAVLNYDDPIVRTFAEKTKAKIVWFSRKEKVTGAYEANGALYYGEEKITEISELAHTEPHNIENALAAIACAKLLGTKSEAISSVLKTFKGAPHRIEYAGEADGVTYIDDSKSTNTDSAIKAAECMKNDTILLLGGKDKGYNYDALFAALKKTRVIRCVLYGENAFKILESAARSGYKNITLTEKFVYAVKIARLLAVSGQTVLLSPASASFDEFSSYEERGDAFVSIVRSWQREENERQPFAAEQAKACAAADGNDDKACGDGKTGEDDEDGSGAENVVYLDDTYRSNGRGGEGKEE